MNRRILVFFAALFACGLAYALLKHEVPVVLLHPKVSTEADDAGFELARAREKAVQEQETRAYSEELGAMEKARRMRDQAAAKMPAERRLLQLSRQSSWDALISGNLKTFQALRAQAVLSREKRVPCTICDGYGMMDHCILCEKSGKCVTCNGKGSEWSNELCPTCLGSGKCFVCFGAGKMPCSFCDDGMVSSKLRSPPEMMPVD